MLSSPLLFRSLAKFAAFTLDSSWCYYFSLQSNRHIPHSCTQSHSLWWVSNGFITAMKRTPQFRILSKLPKKAMSTLQSLASPHLYHRYTSRWALKGLWFLKRQRSPDEHSWVTGRNIDWHSWRSCRNLVSGTQLSCLRRSLRHQNALNLWNHAKTDFFSCLSHKHFIQLQNTLEKVEVTAEDLRSKLVELLWKLLDCYGWKTV